MRVIYLIGTILLTSVLLSHVPAQGEAFYNITSIEATQLSNGVQVKITGDGWLWYTYEKWDDAPLYADWSKYDPALNNYSDVILPTKVIGMSLRNARSQVGSFVFIDKYPVSHVQLSIPPATEIRRDGPVGNQLDIEIILYTGAKLRIIQTGMWCQAYPPEWLEGYPTFTMFYSEDHRSILVSITTDRKPDSSDHRRIEDTSAAQQDLKIAFNEGRLDVHARNVRISDLCREVESVSGRRIEVEPSVERLVTAELPSISPDEFVQLICQCYGLTTEGSPRDRLLICEGMDLPGRSYGQHEVRRIPVRWITAAEALQMLPNFLLRYAKVDTENNQLVFSASTELAAKVQADVSVLDRPSKTVSIEARLVEISSSLDVDTQLGLRYRNDAVGSSVDLPSVQFSVLKSNATPAEFSAALRALMTSGAARTLSSAKLVVISGGYGTLTAGVDKYIQVREPWENIDTVVPVTAGLHLSVLPRVTGKRVLLTLGFEVSNITSIDPATKLPVLDTRKAGGAFQVGSGETIVIGGLDLLQDYGTKRNVPVIGDLPGVGGLFRKNVRQRQNTHLVMLLTPTITEEINAAHAF